MAFNCTAHRPECFQEAVVTDPSGKWGVMAPIGFDPDGPLTFYFVVHTYPAEGSTEFAFCLLVRNNGTGRTAQSYDSLVTNALIPKACRQHISAILQHYSREVILQSSPAEFFMETYSTNLPPAALVKYDILCQIFSSLGYTVTPTPSKTAGKHLWVMKHHLVNVLLRNPDDNS
jgi:hypothetical protein